MTRGRAFGVALVLAVGLLFATRQVGGGYALHGMYRAQVDAILDGRFALSQFPEGMAHDLAWTSTGTQQVWGLGVPLWQTPFEALGRLVGLQPFPDRVALALWIAMGAFVVFRAFRSRSDDPGEPRASGIGAALILVLLPAFVTLMRARLGVYEEAAAYSYVAGIALLGGLVAFVRRPSHGGLLVLLLCAGAVGLIRPTVWFYGAATAIVASGVWLRVMRARGLPTLVIGAVLFVAGGAVLYGSNQQRFGAGSEFGHRLNVHSIPGNIVATRFSYPFERAGVVDAAAELGGAMFDRPEQGRVRNFFEHDLHVGQSDLPRFREYYFTTYSWPYAPLLVGGLVLGAFAWRRRDPRSTQHLLWAWAIIAAAPLVVFYLRAPSLTSRYLLDLGPAIGALLVIVWRAFARALAGRRVVPIVLLAGAWAAAIVTSRAHRPKIGGGPVDREAALDAYKLSRPFHYDRVLPGAYDLDDPMVGSYTDVSTFASCTDELGNAIACEVDRIAGDRRTSGVRDGSRWSTETIEAFEPELCELSDGLDRRDELGEVVVASHVTPPPLYLNAMRWDLATGEIPPATWFYVDDPRFVDLDVDGPGDLASAFRVNLDRDHLALVSVASTANGLRLHYAARASGLHVVFVAAGDDLNLERERSGYSVRRIAWR